MAGGGPGERQTVLHSWCVQSEWDAPTITGGRIARLFTADARSILDMSSLAECSSRGHPHPRVVAGIVAQAQEEYFLTNAWGDRTHADEAAGLLESSRHEALAATTAI